MGYTVNIKKEISTCNEGNSCILLAILNPDSKSLQGGSIGGK